MALKDTVLSRLLGTSPKGAEEEPQAEAPAPAQVPAPAPPPAPEPENQLRLSPDHAVNRLWRLWKEQAGAAPMPAFRFDVPEGQKDLMSPVGARQELARLQLTVNTSANQRLAKAFPKEGNGDSPPPSPDLDAQVVVYVANDRLTAWLFAYPPTGEGGELDQVMLDKALSEKQVRFGVDEELLDRLPDDPARYFRLFPVAFGKRAVNGKDGQVVDLFARKPERKFVVDEYNRVDYASLNLVQNVEEGATICRIVLPTLGEPGKTVLGQDLPAKNGRAVTAPKGRNTELSEDGTRLIASRTGHVEFNGRTFQVKPVLEIDGNVDYSTGHINFPGDVHIHGDICTGFIVRAMGGITVDGVVEACTVEAGGSLTMVKGAQGDNRAVLRAGGSIYAKYLENCCVYAMENLQADCIINCNVYCDGVVEVRTDRGTIIGGSIRAAHEVSACVIGSRAESRTDVTLGGMPCLAFDHEVLVREIADLEERLEKTDRQPESPTKFTRMGKMRMQLALAKSKLEQFNKELDELSQEEQGTPGLRRMTCGIVYPGTVLTIDSAVYRFEYETHPCTAYLAEGEIRLT